jgi:hypothetical protein
MARIAQHLPRASDLLVIPSLSPSAPVWRATNNERNAAMTKTLDVMSDALRNPKHPFRKVDCRPKKAQKHRYERRKIREYLHLGDWHEQAA